MTLYDYDTLLADYHTALQETLRHFNPGHAFLDGWVPDDCLETSLLNLFESADASGVDSLAIRVKEATSEKLIENVSKFGLLEAKDSLITFQSFRSQVPPCYLRRITEAAREIAYEDRTKLAPGENVFVATKGDARLTYVASEERAFHSGAKGLERIVLDRLCRELPSASALIATEEGLREEMNAVPVAGISLPSNFHPMFALARDLLRKLSLPRITRGEFSEWAKLTELQKGQAIRSLLPQGVFLVGIRQESRAVVSVTDPALIESLIKIERVLRRQLGEAIEIVLQPREDKNKRATNREASL